MCGVFRSKSQFCVSILVLLLIGIGSLGCSAKQAASHTDPISAPTNHEIDLTGPAIPSDCVEFQKLVDSTYNFKPSKLSAAEQTAKSKEMDLVWEKVKAEPTKMKSCLVAALESPSANGFFRFDGATLLYSLDKSDDAKKLLIKSYARADLEDIMLQNWIAYILQFGLQGLDTSAAGDAWLRARNPYYQLPQHGTLKVAKKIGALAIFGSMDEQFASPALIKIASQKDHPGRDIAAELLSKQVTLEAFNALTNMDRSDLSGSTRSAIDGSLTTPKLIAKREGSPKVSRAEYIDAFKALSNGRAELFMDLVGRVPDGEKDAIVVLLPEDVPLIRKARRFFASTGTPHAAEWYQSFTDILMVMVWKPELDRRKTVNQ